MNRARMRETTVAASIVIDMVAHLEARGIPRKEICRRAGIDPAALEAPDERLAGSAVERLWQVGEELTGDPDLGIHSAEAYNPGALDILGYVLLNCRTAAEALSKLGRYAALINDGLRVTIARDGANTSCRLEAIAGLDNYLLREPRQVMEAMAAGIVRTLAMLTAERIAPREVTFLHPAPAAVAEARRVFGDIVRFGGPENRIVFLTADLERPVRSANRALLEVFERHADERLADLEGDGPVGRRVVGVLRERLRGDVPGLGEVASEIAMSARNLQRALKGEGTSFQDLLDRVRRDLALQQLARQRSSAAEVAFLLGFSDASAFTRAFRRWTGSTPGAWRARAANPA